MKGSIHFDWTVDPPVITASIELPKGTPAPSSPVARKPAPDDIDPAEVAADPTRFVITSSGLMWDLLSARLCRVVVGDPPLP